MNRLNFSHNWNNKLDCKVFSTIQLHDQFEVGRNFGVWLKEQYLFTAVCIAKRQKLLAEFTDTECYLDTGYSKQETEKIIRRMYAKADFTTQLFTFVLLRKV